MHPFNKSLQISKIVVDYLLILITFILAYFLRVHFVFSSAFPFWDYFGPAMVIAFPWLFILYYARAYKIEQNVRNFRHFERIVFTNLVGIAAYLILFFFLRKFLFSRLIIVYIFILSTTFIFISHYIFSILARHYYAKGVGVYRTLIIGTNREAKKLIKKLKDNKSIHMPVAILDAYGSKTQDMEGVPIKGKLNKFEETVHKENIQQIIQTDNLEQTINIMNFALQHKIKYALLPSLLGAYHTNQYIDELEGVAVLRIE